jgi:hypothetical protein
MVPSPQKSSVKTAHKPKRFPWLLGMIVSLGFIAILAFVIVTLLTEAQKAILRSLGAIEDEDVR